MKAFDKSLKPTMSEVKLMFCACLTKNKTKNIDYFETFIISLR